MNLSRECIRAVRPLTNQFPAEKSSLFKKVQMRGSKGGKGLSLPFVSEPSCQSEADNADGPFSASWRGFCIFETLLMTF